MPKSKDPNKRRWEPRELRLCSEFLARFYPDNESQTHVHLGPSLTRVGGRFTSDEEAKLVGVFRRWADALVFLPDRVILIEAKILPQPGVISQLQLYAELIPKTPELSEHKDKWVERLLVCAIEDSLITELARREGIRVIIFRPVWIDDYMKIVHPWEASPGLNNL
jgi:hypothetical protein